jgi:cAMP phosphodiesterase
MAQIKILGCSGGIGGDLRTTSILLDHDILIDAGSGVGDLSMDALLAIDHIFVTHSHLDHVAFIPFLVDTVMGIRAAPITLHATQETLDILQAHLFNWVIWPDFNAIPSRDAPFLRYNPIQLGETITLGGRKITSLPVEHVVPAVGYQIEGESHSLVYTGDTTVCDALWQAVNKIHNLKYIIIETAFSNDERALAKVSKHLCPETLVSELGKLSINELNGSHSVMQPEVFITHLKPGEGEIIMREIAESELSLPVSALQRAQIFKL